MTTTDQERVDALRHAAAGAALAPSIHNTQPWRFRLTRRALELRIDPERQLKVLDPGFRQLMISCGCALFNARVRLAASRYEVTVERFPDPAEPDLFARIEVGEPTAPWTPLVRLDAAIDRRRSNRREFFETRVSDEVLWDLGVAATAEDATLVPVRSIEDRRIVAELVREADALEHADPDYQAELQLWTTQIRSRTDGVTADSYPQTTARRGDVPLRDFGARVSGLMPPVEESGIDQCLLVLGTTSDDRPSWLRAGEALERLWLEAERLDHVASIISQPIEVRQTR
ncbi:MAG TPA: hypothetical protein VFU98_19915, partial [Microlunatus sp.]|nr:hypothetical protein [Microlunatus sp.]